MKRIIYTQADGSVAVVTPVINTHPVRENITEDDALHRAWDRLPPDAVDPQVIDESLIPTDRTFRDAWKVVAGGVDHDMTKAREIHKARLRVMRVPKLAQLDTEYMRADEDGDAAKKAEIVSKKQALRDVTAHPDIAAAQNIAQLKAAIPAALK